MAAKVLKAQQALAPGFSEHLQREARAVVQLNLSNILPIYDFGQLEGLSYIAITLAGHGETG